MGPTDHNWRIPAHYSRCISCSLTRKRINRESQTEAYLHAKIHALAAGAPMPLVSPPTYRRRAIRVPRGPLTVTIQLPDLPFPVEPDEPVRLGLGQRKRPFSQVQPSRNQIHAPAPSLFDPQSTQATAQVGRDR
ncbi:hypothetical protein F5Y05DRAFT_332885 [Hypoxylon sp. FL0543]|nr:hypothetical protein F5Y05DRAFT_332885 [Hypoxylon sp. FL0543]